MVKDSYIASSSFVGSLLTALEYHKLALVLVKKGKVADGFTFVAKCAKVAKEMSNVAEGLTIGVCELIQHTKTALKSTIEEKTSVCIDLSIKIANIAVDGPKEKKLEEEMAAMEAMGVRKDSLEKAIKTLRIVIEHYDQIHVIFNKTKVYWNEVEKVHKKISCHDGMNSLNAKEIERSIGEIEKFALNLFVLGRINCKAKKEINGALLKNLSINDQAVGVVGFRRGEEENNIMQSYS